MSLWPDLAAASISASLIAPVIAFIDKSLIPSNAPVATKPKPRVSVIRPVGIVWTLYATTYSVANTGDSLSSRAHYQHASLLASAATVVVNVPLGIWKDLRFAQLFAAPVTISAADVSAARMATGTTRQQAMSTVAKGVENEMSRTYRKENTQRSGGSRGGRLATGAFFFRDLITIVASFTLAPRYAEYLTASGMFEPPDSHHPHEMSQKATIVAQLVVPVLSQVVATPVHLLGLDSFSRPSARWMERTAFIRKHVRSTTVGRCLRIIPAFGVGCLVNTELRVLFS